MTPYSRFKNKTILKIEMNKQSNLDLLNNIFNKCEKGKLLEKYEKLNKNTKVHFICDDCEKEDSKSFDRIKDLGPYCKKCIMNKRKEKLEKTMLEKYGVKNANDMPGTKEKIKETKDKKYTKEQQEDFLKKCHEGSKKRWENYRNQFRPFLDVLKKEGKAICKYCNEEKTIDKFQKYISNYTKEELYDIKCYDCKYKEKSENKENKRYTVEEFLLCIFKDKKNANDTRNNKRKDDKFKEFNLTHEYLIELWNKQNGKCAYSGRNMIYNYSKKDYNYLNYNPEKVSIDRIDSSKGYIQGNIVLCCIMSNIMKMDLPYEEFKKWINDIHKNINNN
jgi:hypothetical protein